MVLSDNVDYNDSDGYYLYEMGKMEGNSSAMMYSARRFSVSVHHLLQFGQRLNCNNVYGRTLIN